MLNIYDKLITLPLFIGIGNEELSQIIAHIRIGFHKIEAGKYICKENHKCDKLLIVTNGTFSVTSYSNDYHYSIEEEVNTPMILQPSHLFGLTAHYTKDFKTITKCNLISLDKVEVLKLLEKSLIFRLNFINLISIKAQHSGKLPWGRKPETIEKAFIQFVRNRCIIQSGHKVIHIKMTDLACEIHESRLNISKMLSRLKAKGLLNNTRGVISIPLLEKLR